MPAGIFAALQNKSPETVTCSCNAAFKDRFFIQPVSLRFFVGTADTAVKTVIGAIIGKLNDPPDKDFAAEVFQGQNFCTFCSFLSEGGTASLQQIKPPFFRKRPFFLKFIKPCFEVFHFLLFPAIKGQQRQTA
jgi:hypothetical protein